MKVLLHSFVLGIALWLSGPDSTPARAQDLLLITTLTTDGPIIGQPYGVAVDGSGNVYGSDWWASIWKLTPDGVLSTFAGNPTNLSYADGTGTNALFCGPNGVAVDRAGNLYVADQGNYVIRKVTPAGVVSTFAGQAGHRGYQNGPKTSALFYGPNYIAVDRSGNLYLTEASNYAIRMIGTNGLVSTIAGSRWYSGYADGIGTNALFNYPQGIAADNAGNVYVVDEHNDVIRKLALDSTGTNWVVSTIAGQPGVSGYADGVGTNAVFSDPHCVALDTTGNLYVSEWNNNAIRKLALDSTGTNWVVSTLAGGYGWGLTDGIGTNAQFNIPTGIAVDSLGKVYVGQIASLALRLGVPYPVPLQVRLSAHQAVLSWPASAAGFVLETSATASDGSWTPLTTGIVTLGNSCFLTNAITSDTAFYRLHHP